MCTRARLPHAFLVVPEQVCGLSHAVALAVFAHRLRRQLPTTVPTVYLRLARLLARLAPVDDAEAKKAKAALGEGALEKLYRAVDLSHGDNVVFCATAISDATVLDGIRINGSLASTHSMVMRSRYRTIRYIKTDHDLSRKMIRLHSTKAESNL